MCLASAVKAHHHLGYAATDVPDLYGWATLGSALIVHVRGSKGEIAVEWAKSFARVKLLVQDMEVMVHGGKDNVSDELKDRIDFKASGLFDTQNMKADAYLPLGSSYLAR
ncbi:hypothetical protein F4678DRAFT_464330 [Xylaria arbuscula]|nr:hypothetical protein F4678DRAFT_464330 [Xylaria arbuscula]